MRKTAVISVTAIFAAVAFFATVAIAPFGIGIFLFGGLVNVFGSGSSTSAAPQEYCGKPGTLPSRVPQPLNGIFTEAANYYKIDPAQLAVIYTSENGWVYREPPPPYGNGKPWPTSPKAASGPFQFIPGTWLAYASSNPKRTVGNINDLRDAAYASAHYLKDLGAKPGMPFGSASDPHRGGTFAKVMGGYNAGPAGNFFNRETQRYITMGAREYAMLKGTPAPAGGSAPDSAACNAPSGGKVPPGYPNSDQIPCKAGRDVGVFTTAKGNKVRVCEVAGTRVNSSIATNYQGLVNAAKSDGITLTAYGFRQLSDQIRLRRQNCGPSQYATYQMPSNMCRPNTAIPGTSWHEQGQAVDLQCNGVSLTSRGMSCFQWMSTNAKRYGFINLPSEPWHWQTQPIGSELR